MKINSQTLALKSFLHTIDMKPTMILIVSTILLALHRYFGSIEFALKTWTNWSEMNTAIFMFSTAFIVLGIIPFCIVKYGLHERLADYGLTLGDWKTGLRSIAILFPIIAILLLYPSSQTDEMRAYYPFVKGVHGSAVAFIQLELLRGLFFYTAWEFFFRGFMLFGMKESVGDWMAICIQVIPSCLWHIGCPTGETFSSITAGIMFGLLAIKTRSILYPLLLHFLIGITLDLFIVITI